MVGRHPPPVQTFGSAAQPEGVKQFLRFAVAKTLDEASQRGALAQVLHQVQERQVPRADAHVARTGSFQHTSEFVAIRCTLRRGCGCLGCSCWGWWGLWGCSCWSLWGCWDCSRCASGSFKSKRLFTVNDTKQHRAYQIEIVAVA